MTTVEALLHEPPFAELAARREVTREQLAAFFEALDAPLPSFTEGEADFLADNAGMSDKVRRRLHDRATADGHDADERALLTQIHVRTSAQMHEGSWDARQAQRHLGKSHSTLSRWHGAGRLYAFETASGRRYPRWQFVPDEKGALGPLPGLDAVLLALPAGVAPLAFEALMTAQNPVLQGAAPVDVLAARGDVDAVVALVRDEWGHGR